MTVRYKQDDLNYISHEVRLEVVNKGTESHPISPGGRQVCDLDPFITFRDLLAPGQKVKGGTWQFAGRFNLNKETSVFCNRASEE